ncbi:MAG: DUF2059 domain-containing protein [Muribaculaceae bacterium]|nr:DUF2059 domain-containing protein [Muribaculaceae bacterium]
MKKLIHIFATILIVVSVSFSAKAQSITPEYRQTVAELLALTNVRQITEETLATTYNNMGMKFTIPTSEVVNIMIGKVWEGMVDDFAIIYAKYFNFEEICQLRDFYNTPLGKKLSKYLPEVNRDALLSTQKYESEFVAVLSQYIAS